MFPNREATSIQNYFPLPVPIRDQIPAGLKFPSELCFQDPASASPESECDPTVPYYERVIGACEPNGIREKNINITSQRQVIMEKWKK